MKKSFERASILAFLFLPLVTLVGCSTSSTTSGESAKTSLSESAKPTSISTSVPNSPTPSDSQTPAPPSGLFDTTVVEPTKLFDNLYYVGYKGVGSFVVNTSDGIILIDTMWTPNDARDVIVPGIKKLGLDPANIKNVLITHGHSDHYGSSTYFEDNFGSTIFMSKIDWEYMMNPNAPVLKDPFGNTSDKCPKPKKYTELKDGQKLTLGDTSITIVSTPGHTPGCLSLIIPVKDNGVPHIVAVMGGTGLPSTLEENETYLKSLNYFETMTDAANVDAEINFHPFVDKLLEKMSTLQNRKQEDSNPVVIGKEEFKKYLDSSLRKNVVDKIASFKK